MHVNWLCNNHRSQRQVSCQEHHRKCEPVGYVRIAILRVGPVRNVRERRRTGPPNARVLTCKLLQPPANKAALSSVFANISLHNMRRRLSFICGHCLASDRLSAFCWSGEWNGLLARRLPIFSGCWMIIDCTFVASPFLVVPPSNSFPYPVRSCIIWCGLSAKFCATLEINVVTRRRNRSEVDFVTTIRACSEKCRIRNLSQSQSLSSSSSFVLFKIRKNIFQYNWVVFVFRLTIVQLRRIKDRSLSIFCILCPPLCTFFLKYSWCRWDFF